ncbi:sulfatase-like hydrolase/transferase [Paenibacillus sp. YYML68]|uniref:sulfatase-like hydrolase/transferase n=1 Tax=Paenibacillus sp. YYML68 TaxID=2909250 RepID=UPI00248FBB23|nr:sulfatase-like hydrolase/transferase [Paenibacillus sp. YYML68]
MRTKPHIFFIMTDELRADTLGYRGHPIVKTPHLDALAADSAVFTNAYTNSPMCAPARVSLATGRHGLSHGVLDNAFAPVDDEQSLYETMRCGGYRTINYGKIHFNTPGNFGFEEHYPHGLYSSGGVSVFGVTDRELQKRSVYKKNEGEISLVIHGVNPQRPEETADSLVTQAYVDRLEELKDSERPLLHRLSLIDPHTPYFPAEPYASMYAPESIPLPSTWDEDLSTKPLLHRYYYRARGFDRLTEDDYRRSLASYYGLITHVDDRVGQVVARLKELDLYDDSILVFTSDHGSMMGEHGFIEKWGIMYEEVSRIPLLIKFPKSMHKGTYEAFAEIVDIMPTLLDAAGLEVPERVQGRSLLPMLRGEPGAAKTEVFGHIFTGGLQTEPALMMRKEQWKLTVYPGQERIHDRLQLDHYLKYTPMFLEAVVEGELYNLDDDPIEARNLFDDPQHQEMKEALMYRLAEWRSGLGELADYEALDDVRPVVNSYHLMQGDNMAKMQRLLRAEGTVTQLSRQRS